MEHMTPPHDIDVMFSKQAQASNNFYPCSVSPFVLAIVSCEGV